MQRSHIGLFSILGQWHCPSAFKSGLTWTADLALFAGGTTTPGMLYPATRVLR